VENSRGLNRPAITSLIRAALREDRARHDITSRVVLAADASVRACLVAKAPGVVAGGPVAGWAFTVADPSVRYRQLVADGSRVRPGQTIATVSGDARSIFAAERVALNLLGHLSGIASVTRTYVRRVRGTRAAIFDTRKTLPGLRRLEKYAVRVGGGRNHRMDLSDAILIKTNHLRALSHGPAAMNRAILQAIHGARRAAGQRLVEIEVANLREFKTALEARPDAILLDNWRLADIRKAVALRRGARRPRRGVPLLEVSGGITLANVRAVAKTGVDRISIGRLTHSAPALEVALQVIA